MPPVETASRKTGMESRSGFVGLIFGAARTLMPPGVRLLGAMVQFLSTILIARQLGDEGSADFFLWSALLLSFAPVASFGLEYLALRNVPRMKKSEIGGYLAGLRLITGLFALLIGAGLILYGYLRAEEGVAWENWFLLLPVTLGSMTLALINGEALKGDSRPVSGILFGHTVPVTLFFLLIVLLGDRLTSPTLIGLYSLSYLVAVVVAQLGPFRTMGGGMFHFPSREAFLILIHESWPVFLAGSFGALSYVVPLLVLDSTRPSEEVSYVTTAFRISILFWILTGAIHSVFAPGLSREAAVTGNRTSVFRVYRKAALSAIACLGIPIFIGIIFPGTVMSVFGESFRSGAEELSLLLFLLFLTLCLGPAVELLLMLGRTQLMMKLGFCKLVIAVVLSLLLIPSLGGVGMVIALAASFLTEDSVALYLANRHLRQEEKNSIVTA